MRGNDNRNLQAFGEFAALCVFAEGRFHCGGQQIFYKLFRFLASDFLPTIYNNGRYTNTKVKFAAGI